MLHQEHNKTKKRFTEELDKLNRENVHAKKDLENEFISREQNLLTNLKIKNTEDES